MPYEESQTPCVWRLCPSLRWSSPIGKGKSRRARRLWPTLAGREGHSGDAVARGGSIPLVPFGRGARCSSRARGCSTPLCVGHYCSEDAVATAGTAALPLCFGSCSFGRGVGRRARGGSSPPSPRNYNSGEQWPRARGGPGSSRVGVSFSGEAKAAAARVAALAQSAWQLPHCRRARGGNFPSCAGGVPLGRGRGHRGRGALGPGVAYCMFGTGWDISGHLCAFMCSAVPLEQSIHTAVKSLRPFFLSYFLLMFLVGA